MTQQLKPLTTLVDNMIWFPEPTLGSSLLPITPVPGDLMASGFYGCLHAGDEHKFTQVYIYIKYKYIITKELAVLFCVLRQDFTVVIRLTSELQCSCLSLPRSGITLVALPHPSWNILYSSHISCFSATLKEPDYFCPETHSFHPS